MAAYTIEDIELIRRKSGISYQEAVALLDYHNGNVARALVDLERNGRIRDESEVPHAGSTPPSSTGAGKQNNQSSLMALINKGYRARIKVHRNDTQILNISLLFALLTLLISPHIAIIGVIASLALGYKFSFEKHDHAFDGENLERTVRNAAENVRSTVNEFASNLQHDEEEAAQSSSTDRDRSYYNANRPEPTYRPSCPTLNVPVQVESQDGNVTIESDSEGYASATIE